MMIRIPGARAEQDCMLAMNHNHMMTSKSVFQKTLYDDLRLLSENIGCPFAVSGNIEEIVSIKTILGEYSEESYSLQGAVYNTTTGRLLLCFSGQNNGLLIELTDDFSVTKRAPISAGHLNDITYDENKELYFIAPDLPNGKVICVDPITLKIKKDISIKGLGEISQISYDKLSECYYVCSNARIYKCNSSFTESEEKVNCFSIFENNYDSYSRFVQGSIVVDGRFVSLLWLGSASSSYSRLCFLNKANDGIEYFYDYKNRNSIDEGEAIVNIKDHFYILSYAEDNLIFNRIFFNGFANNDDVSYAPAIISYSPGSSLLEDIHNFPFNREIYQYYVGIQTPHEGLGTLNGFLIGFKVNNAYGTQVFISPDRLAMRFLKNSIWTEWKRVGYLHDNIPVHLTPCESIKILENNTYEKDGLLYVSFKFECLKTIEPYGSIANTGYYPKVGWIGQVFDENRVMISSLSIYSDMGNADIRASISIPPGIYNATATILIE